MTESKPLVVWTTCHPWIQEVVAEVQPDEFDVEFLDLDDDDAVVATLPRTDFLICLGLTTAQARMLGRCKLVMHNGVGYDAIDRVTLAEMGIPVAVTPAMTPEGVSEHALMLILALSKQLPAVRESMQSGVWNMFGWREGSHNLSYKTLGIIGPRTYWQTARSSSECVRLPHSVHRHCGRSCRTRRGVRARTSRKSRTYCSGRHH